VLARLTARLPLRPGRAYHPDSMPRPISAVVLALLLWASAASAQQDAGPNGLGLLERCNALSQLEQEGALALDPEIRQNYGYCLGFVVGFVSGFAGRDALGVEGRFCPPGDTRIAEFVAAIQAWLVAHPEGLEQPGALVAIRAFQSAFPCPPEALRPER
jgi:hypothetical protein